MLALTLGITANPAVFFETDWRNTKMAKAAVKTAPVDGADEQSTETEANGASASTASKRQAKAFVTYVMSDGKEMNFPNKDATLIRFTLMDESKLDYPLDGVGENVKACAVQQGIVTRVQRGYQALKQIDEISASIEADFNELDKDIWLEIGTGEPRITNLVQAVVMALEAKGETVDAARQKAITDKLSGEDAADLRKETRERPAIAANLATLAREAAQVREEKKRALALASGVDDTAGF